MDLAFFEIKHRIIRHLHLVGWACPSLIQEIMFCFFRLFIKSKPGATSDCTLLRNRRSNSENYDGSITLLHHSNGFNRFKQVYMFSQGFFCTQSMKSLFIEFLIKFREVFPSIAGHS